MTLGLLAMDPQRTIVDVLGHARAEDDRLGAGRSGKDGLPELKLSRTPHWPQPSTLSLFTTISNALTDNPGGEANADLLV